MQDEACGNGVVDAGEGCDDGNTTGGDGCSANCQEEECGNGVVDVGEECDDGDTDSGDGCSSECTIEECGNGTVDAGEGCDDGNSTLTDACPDGPNGTCQPAVCGDGFVYAGTEECDGGNDCVPAGQPNECTIIIPMDGGMDGGTDGGMDGGMDAGVGCGNGIVEPGEECDNDGPDCVNCIVDDTGGVEVGGTFDNVINLCPGIQIINGIPSNIPFGDDDTILEIRGADLRINPAQTITNEPEFPDVFVLNLRATIGSFLSDTMVCPPKIGAPNCMFDTMYICDPNEPRPYTAMVCVDGFDGDPECTRTKCTEITCLGEPVP